PGVLLLPALLASLGCGIPMCIGGIKMGRLTSYRWANSALTAGALLTLVWPCSWTLAYAPGTWSPDAAAWYMLHFMYLPAMAFVCVIWAAGIFVRPAAKYAYEPSSWMREKAGQRKHVAEEDEESGELASASQLPAPGTATSDAPEVMSDDDQDDRTSCL